MAFEREGGQIENIDKYCCHRSIGARRAPGAVPIEANVLLCRCR